MQYNISKYIIEQKLDDNEHLLYSTLSTSIVVLENQVYQDIFVDLNFGKHKKECEDLEEMGFIFRGDPNLQLNELKEVRSTIVDSDHGITAITIAPTMKCNARCYYCFEKGALQGTMSLQTADKVVEFLSDRCKEKKLYIAWFGGEPLMATDIITYITEKLLRNGIEIESTVTTNGILIDEKMINNFKKWNVIRVQITLDGLGEEYNKIKRYIIDCDNPFERVINNIQLMIDNDICVHLRVNYYSKSYVVVKETMDYLHNRFGDYENLYLYGVPLDLPETC